MDAWQLLLALAPYVAPPLIGAVAVLVRAAYEKMPSSKQALAQQVVGAVVAGVQQQATANGAIKKQMAVETASSILDSYGVKVSPALINTLVESTVYSIKSVETQSLPPAMPRG